MRSTISTVAAAPAAPSLALASRERSWSPTRREVEPTACTDAPSQRSAATKRASEAATAPKSRCRRGGSDAQPSSLRLGRGASTLPRRSLESLSAASSATGSAGSSDSSSGKAPTPAGSKKHALPTGVSCGGSSASLTLTETAGPPPSSSATPRAIATSSGRPGEAWPPALPLGCLWLAGAASSSKLMIFRTRGDEGSTGDASGFAAGNGTPPADCVLRL